jgi:hypothetical protein
LAQLAPRVSTAVLLQALAHFKSRVDKGLLRVSFPKGDLAKVFALCARLPAIAADTAQLVVDTCECTLLAWFAQLPPLGRCHVEPPPVESHPPHQVWA